MSSPAALIAARSASEEMPPGQDHRDRHRPRQCDRRFDVRAGQHAVAADIGKDDRRDTDVLEPPGEVERRDVRLLRPALYRDATARGRRWRRRFARESRRRPSERDPDRAAPPFRGSPAGRPGPANWRRSPACGCRLPAAPVCRSVSRMASTAIAVDRTAGEGAVEIDDMQPAAAGLLEGACLIGRILVEHRGGVHVALAQAHAPPLFQVDGRERRSRPPPEKVGDQAQPGRLALLRMKLRSHQIVAADHRDHRRRHIRRWPAPPPDRAGESHRSARNRRARPA